VVHARSTRSHECDVKFSVIRTRQHSACSAAPATHVMPLLRRSVVEDTKMAAYLQTNPLRTWAWTWWACGGGRVAQRRGRQAAWAWWAWALSTG
jgi:hypothetical protein